MAGRRVYVRAILIAFSTASAPLLVKIVFLGKLPGVFLLSHPATST